METVNSNYKYNVSKKIAQLTKVVFRLHTEALDRKDAISQVRKKCDDEFTSISKQVQEMQEKYQQEIKDVRENFMSTVKTEYEERMIQMKDQYNAERHKLDTQVSSIMSSSEGRINDLKGQLDQAKFQLENSRKIFLNATKEIMDKCDESVALLRKKHAEECSSLVNESNSKYNQLLLSSTKREDELMKKLEQHSMEMSKLNAEQYESQITLINNKCLELERQLKAAQQEKQESIQTISTMKATNVSLQNEIAKLKKGLEEDRGKALKSSKVRISELENELSEQKKRYDTEIIKMSAEIRELKERHYSEFQKQAENAEMSKISLMNAQKDLINKHIEDKSNMQHRYEVLEEQMKRSLEELRNKHNKDLESANLRENDLKEQLVALSMKMKAQELQIDQMIQAEKNQASISICAVEQQYQKEIQLIKDGIDEKTKSATNSIIQEKERLELMCRALLQEKNNLENKLQEAISNAEVTMQKLQNLKEADIRTLKQSHDSMTSTLVHNYEKKIQRLDEQHQQEVSDIESVFQAKLKQSEEKSELSVRVACEKLREDLEKIKTEEMERLKDQLDMEMRQLKNKFDKKDTELRESDNQIRRMMTDYENKIYDLQAIINRLQEELLSQKKKQQMSTEDNLNSLKNQLSERDIYYQRQINNIEQKYSNQVAALKAEHKDTLDLINNDTEKRMLEHKNITIALSNSIEELKMNNTLMKEEYEKIIQDLNEKIKSHESSIHQLEKTENSSHQDQIKLLMNRIEDLKIQLEKQTHEKQNEIQRSNKDMRDAMILLEEQIKNDSISYQQRIKDIEQIKNKEIESLKEKMGFQIEKLQSDMQQIIYREKSDEIMHQNKIKSLEVTHQTTLEQEIQKNHRVITDLIASHSEQIKQKESEINSLKAQIVDLNDKYMNQGARPQDIEKIQLLEEQLNERTDMLTKLFNELKHYQHELVNREATYNKVFTSKPNIAVLNVLEKRMKSENSLEKTGKTLPPLGEVIEKVERRSKSSIVSARRKNNESK